MTSDQILRVVGKYISDFKGSVITPRRFSSVGTYPNTPEALEHAYWMALEVQTFADSSPEKAMRWLCFIQGVMWSFYGSTIDDFKDDNRSP